MAKFLLLSLVFVCVCFRYAYCAKILGVFHGAAHSHQLIGSKLLYELAARGHEVTSLVPDEFVPKQPIKNFKAIKLDFQEFIKGALPNVFDEPNRGIINRIIFMDMMGLLFSEITLNRTSVQDLLKSNEHFDMIIMEQFFNEAFKGFCYHYKAHCVVVSTVATSRWTNPQMGNPNYPSYVPDINLMYPSKMNFFQRLHNTFSYVFATLVFIFYSLPKQNELLQKNFPGAPHINELYYNTSLMLLNSHVSINPALPLLPNMITIGGYHIDPPKELPKDLQEYLDGAKNGAIYFSMGSHIQPHTMPKEKLATIIKVLSKLKQKVLWKFNDTLEYCPPNVKVSKWFPQNEILAHPNVVVFISHGGLLSTMETIYHGKPIVGIPLLGDQEMNVATAELNGFAKAVSFREITEETLTNGINEVLNNPKYAENAKRRSKIMHDEPMKPLDKAMFWIEYVLRHDGAPQLRTSALDLRWYQLFSLDVALFMLAVVVLILFIACKLCKFIVKRICNKCCQQEKPTQQHKKKRQ